MATSCRASCRHALRSTGRPAWLNSEPLDPAELRGQVVLVDFWTWTCINWLRTEPYVRAWSQAYKDDGLIVIGVHTPEFSSSTTSTACGARRRSGGSTTRSRSTTTTRSGAPSTTTTGRRSTSSTRTASSATSTSAKGGYEQSERVLQRLLGVERELVAVRGATGVEAEADWDHLRHARDVSRLRAGASFVSPTAHARPSRLYGAPDALRPTTGPSSASGRSGARRSCSAEAGGSIAYRFQARDAHLVLSAGAREPIPFRVLLDGEAPGRVTRRRRRRGRERHARGAAACTSSCATRGRSASRRWRSPSSRPVPRPTSFTFG